MEGRFAYLSNVARSNLDYTNGSYIKLCEDNAQSLFGEQLAAIVHKLLTFTKELVCYYLIPQHRGSCLRVPVVLFCAITHNISCVWKPGHPS